MSLQRRHGADGHRGDAADDGDGEVQWTRLLVDARAREDLLQVQTGKLSVRRAGVPADVRLVESQQ